jgi:hypothetical protein
MTQKKLNKHSTEMKNEYHLIKSNDESDQFMNKLNEETHEMEVIKKELDEIAVDGKTLDNNCENNIDLLKEQILENGGN